MANTSSLDDCRQALTSASKILEYARGLESEAEASALWSSSLLEHDQTASVDISDLPGALQDAWVVWAGTSNRKPVDMAKLLQAHDDNEPMKVSLGQGQWSKSLHTTTFHKGLQHAHELSQKIQRERGSQGLKLKELMKKASRHPGQWLTLLDEQIHQLQQYHAQNSKTDQERPSKRMRFGHPASDGYDLVATVVQPSLLQDAEDDDRFTYEQVLGKYLDTHQIYQYMLQEESLRKLFATKIKASAASDEVQYSDFLTTVGQLAELDEGGKLLNKGAYANLLERLEKNVSDFLVQTAPFVDIAVLSQKALEEFKKSWSEKGGFPAQGYACIETELLPIVLSGYSSAQELYQKQKPETLTAELSRLGLKAGGSPMQRAERLWSIKDLPMDRWPAKVLAKKPTWTRYALCALEVKVNALIQQVRPTLEATIAKAHRAAAQTPREAQQEREQDLYGSKAGEKTGDESDDDEPIYNPKNVPLDWDGKPIPYWLFKLHGLQHYFTCEICGGESYRGRHQFEIHFGDPKHTFGLKSLGIPNTKHFHGITKIKDAQELYSSLQQKQQDSQFDANRDEEYEDSQGNVLSRKTYEDLGRQGLL